jgi:hypothetical protein
LSGEENAEFALREDVERFVDGNLDESCFYEDDDGNERFDFDEFDSRSVEDYIRGVVPDTDTGEQREGDGTEVEDSDEEDRESAELSDEQLRELLDLRCSDGSPTKWMQKHYRNFRTSVQ